MELSQCTELATRCRAVADEIESGPFQQMIQRANDAVRIIERSFSGSWLGYHAHVYYLNFSRLRPALTSVPSGDSKNAGPFVGHLETGGKSRMKRPRPSSKGSLMIWISPPFRNALMKSRASSSKSRADLWVSWIWHWRKPGRKILKN